MSDPIQESGSLDAALVAALAFFVLWYRRIVLVETIVKFLIAISHAALNIVFTPASTIENLRRGKEIFMENVLGIESLKAVVVVAATLGNVGGEVMQDGKIDSADFIIVGKLVPMFPALLKVEWAKVVPEVKDLTQAEADDLVAFFKAQFNIPQDAMETKIEHVLDVCVEVSKVVAKLIALFKKPA
jgi:hypothetical protein